jgi:NADH dehydrogenase/NADH:ubiquinone oxidoreductase subunit G
MAKTVRVTIDGVDFAAPEGMNVIDAAELAGIHIPNLCYLKGMKGVGACRLCMVDIEGQKGTSIACTTKVREGMVVRTQTPEIQEQRKFVIDLILSMHPLDCMTCTKAGICNLQRYAYEFGLKKTSFTTKKLGHPVDVNNPFIEMAPDYCVLCGRCIRVCKEQGTNVLEFMGRGVGAKVTTVVDRSLHESDCTFCGSCLDACPVNAIVEADRWRKGREWDYDKYNSSCLVCGNACDIVVNVLDGKVTKIATGAEPGSAMKYICAYGRFAHDYLESETRITKPMVRDEDELKEVGWDEALTLVAEKLKAAGGAAGFLSTASFVTEDMYALKELAANVVGTKHFDSTMSLYADTHTLLNAGRMSINDADTIVLVDINPSQRLRILPMLNVAIRRKVARGAKLIVINDHETKLDKIATARIEGNEIEAIRGFIKAAIAKGVAAPDALKKSVADAAVTEAMEKAAEVFAESQSPIIYTSAALFDAAQNISLMKGEPLTVTYESNARGAALIGLVSKGKSYRDMVSRGAEVLYVVGSIPLITRPDTGFLIVQDTHLTELAKQADVFLPSSTYLEDPGTIVDFKGRVKFIPKMIECTGLCKSHREIFKRIAQFLGKDIETPSEDEIRKLLTVKPERIPRPFERRSGMDVIPEMIIDAINAPLVSGQRLLWLREMEKAARAKARAAVV